MSELSKDDIKQILANCYSSTKMASKVLFPDRFTRPFSSLSDAIFKILDDDSIQKAVICAPRGWGKTSTVNLAYSGKHILFRSKHFIVPISNTATQAVMQSENLKMELQTNRVVRKLFGSVKTNKATDDVDIDQVYSKEMWVANGETMVFPRGSGQQVRGILFRNYRPDLILCDDLEDSESVMSEEQRAKLKQWFFADVLNSVDRGKSDWKIIVIGTLLHEDSLLQNLLDDPTWFHVHITLCDENLHSNWPDFMSDEDVKKLYNSYREQGLLDVFYREYLGVPIAKETAKFKSEFFRYYNETDADFLPVKAQLENIVIVDPAKTTNKESDDTAIVGWGVDIAKPALYVRDVVHGGLHPDEMINQTFAMADRLGARVIGVEVTSLNEFIVYPFKTEMLRRGRSYELVELKARASKDERIAGLIPFYRMGQIFHNAACCQSLEAQLLSYPRSKKKDVMDAAAYVVEMLEMGDRYFQKGDDEEWASEDEFRDIPNEPAERWARVI